MLIDMHMHSVFSDGELKPAELAKKLSELNVGMACLTDHDTFGGTEDFIAAAAEDKLKTIPSVESDCIIPDICYDSEILCYFPEGSFQHTKNLVAIYRERRKKAAEAVIELGRAVNPQLSLNILYDLKLGCGEDNEAQREQLCSSIRITKPDLFKLFQHVGIVDKTMTYKKFKKTYIEPIYKKAPEPIKPHISEVAEAVRKDDGKLVIPHFGHEFEDSADQFVKKTYEAKNMLDYFSRLGVWGLEWYAYRNHEQQELNELIFKLSEPFGFTRTFGSDFHGAASKKPSIIPFEGECQI